MGVKEVRQIAAAGVMIERSSFRMVEESSITSASTASLSRSAAAPLPRRRVTPGPGKTRSQQSFSARRERCRPTTATFTLTAADPSFFKAGANELRYELKNFNAPCPLSVAYRAVIDFTP